MKRFYVFIVRQQTRTQGRSRLKVACPQTKVQIHTYSGKLRTNIKVSFVTTCITEDSSAHVQLGNMALHTSQVQKWWKLSAPGGDVSIITSM